MIVKKSFLKFLNHNRLKQIFQLGFGAIRAMRRFKTNFINSKLETGFKALDNFKPVLLNRLEKP
jgi:hypothetical protein